MPLAQTAPTLQHLDRRGALLRAIDWARTDFTADGGTADDHAVLSEMGEAVALFVEKMQGLARQLDGSREGNPTHSHTWLRDVIAGEVVADHYNLTACAARVLTAAAEAA